MGHCAAIDHTHFFEKGVGIEASGLIRQYTAAIDHTHFFEKGVGIEASGFIRQRVGGPARFRVLQFL